MFFCMAEYCDTLQSKEERNREYKLCLNRGTIVHLLDFSTKQGSRQLQLIAIYWLVIIIRTASQKVI